MNRTAQQTSRRDRLVAIIDSLEHRGNLAETTKLVLRYAPDSALPGIARLVAGFVRWETRFLRGTRRA